MRELMPEDYSDFLGAIKMQMLDFPLSHLPPREGEKNCRTGIIGVDNCNECTKRILRKKCWDCKKIILRY